MLAASVSRYTSPSPLCNNTLLANSVGSSLFLTSISITWPLILHLICPLCTTLLYDDFCIVLEPILGSMFSLLDKSILIDLMWLEKAESGDLSLSPVVVTVSRALSLRLKHRSIFSIFLLI